MHETYLTIDEFARFEGLAAPTVRKNLAAYPAAKIIPASGRGKTGGTLISSTLLSTKGFQRFLACPSPALLPLPATTHNGNGRPNAAADLSSLTAAQRDAALFWESTLKAFDRLLALRPDWTRARAANAFIATLPDDRKAISVRSFLAKYRAWQRDGVNAVAPKSKQGRPAAAIHPELKAWMLKHYIKETQGRSRRLSAEAAILKAAAEGWRPCPSCATLERILKAVPGNVLYAGRGGKALDDFILPATLREHSEPALWMAVGDHHIFDVFVRCNDGKVRRLWCTMWLDFRSRVALGWTPSSRTIAESFRRMALQYGAPHALEIDNGSDYIREQLIGEAHWRRKFKIDISEKEEAQLQGAFEACGVERIVRAIVKNAKSKHVERFFETVEGQFGQGLPGYCGRNTVERKKIAEALGHPVEESPDLLGEDEFEALFAEWIATRYHTRPHRGDGMNGRSPLQCLAEEKQAVIHPSAENLDLLFLEPKRVVMQRQGFLVLGQWYRNPDLQHDYFNPELSTQNRTFILRYAHDDLSSVRVYDRKDVLLGAAPRVGRAAYDNTDEIERRKKEHKHYKKKRDDFWKASNVLLDGDIQAAEHKVYILKKDGPPQPEPMPEPVAPAPSDLERRIHEKLKNPLTSPASMPPPKQTDDRIAARLKSRFF